MTVFIIIALIIACVCFYKDSRRISNEYYQYRAEVHKRMEVCPQGAAILKQYDEELAEKVENDFINGR